MIDFDRYGQEEIEVFEGEYYNMMFERMTEQEYKGDGRGFIKALVTIEHWQTDQYDFKQPFSKYLHWIDTVKLH